jgi:hypothetical protein
MVAAGRMQVSRYMTMTASKWYLYTTVILSLAFKKPYFKRDFEKVSIPFKTLGPFKCFENLAPISKCFAKRYFKPFVCALQNF